MLRVCAAGPSNSTGQNALARRPSNLADAHVRPFFGDAHTRPSEGPHGTARAKLHGVSSREYTFVVTYDAIGGLKDRFAIL
jgi:hypothetical protein